jgi:hypothetical protein
MKILKRSPKCRITKHPYNEPGRRLKAALISYQLGRKGVDSTLKGDARKCRCRDGGEIAEKLLRGMSDQIANLLIPPSEGSNKIQ